MPILRDPDSGLIQYDPDQNKILLGVSACLGTVPDPLYVTFSGLTSCGCVNTGGGSENFFDLSQYNDVVFSVPLISSSGDTFARWRKTSCPDGFVWHTYDLPDCVGSPHNQTNCPPIDIIFDCDFGGGSGTWTVYLGRSPDTGFLSLFSASVAWTGTPLPDIISNGNTSCTGDPVVASGGTVTLSRTP